MSKSKMNPWRPMKKPIDLKHLGKLAEELGGCSSAVSRCLIQGICEREPVTGKINKEWLEDEIADVLANIELVTVHFGLSRVSMTERMFTKINQLKEWHKMS